MIGQISVSGWVKSLELSFAARARPPSRNRARSVSVGEEPVPARARPPDIAGVRRPAPGHRRPSTSPAMSLRCTQHPHAIAAGHASAPSSSRLAQRMSSRVAIERRIQRASTHPAAAYDRRRVARPAPSSSRSPSHRPQHTPAGAAPGYAVGRAREGLEHVLRLLVRIQVRDAEEVAG